MSNDSSIVIILSGRFPFVSIAIKEQIDLGKQPLFCLFIKRKNSCKRVWISCKEDLRFTRRY